MDSESKRIYERMRLHDLMKQHPEWSPVQLAVELGHSERWARKWVRRFQAVSEPSLKMYLSESRAPKKRTRQTPDVVKDVICDLRVSLSEQYHRPAGGHLIRHYLDKEECLKEQGVFIPSSSRTITKILRERGYIVDPPKHEHEPLPRCAPMEEWEMDFCEIRLVDGRFEFFLVVDRGTSRVVYLEGGGGYKADTALDAIMRLFLLHGMPKRLRFDRDPRFVWSWSADGFPSPLVRLLHVLGVEPIICPPRRPDKKPYVERCVRTFKHEWLDRFSLNTMADCHEALEAFPHYHNAERVHFGRACNGRTPDEAFPAAEVHPNAWLESQHGRMFRRRIRANGTIQVDKHVYYVDKNLEKQFVLTHLDAKKRCLYITLDGMQIGKPLPLQDLHDEKMSRSDYLKILQKEAMSIANYREMMWQKSGEVV